MQHHPPSFIRRLATTKRIPDRARRPLEIVLVLVQDFIRCDLLKQATAMAYVTLLSLVPSLVAVFCVMSLFSPIVGKGNSLVTQAREFILENLASSSGEQAVAYLDRMLASLDLKTIGWSSFASVLVTLILLLRQIEEALNHIWLIRKGRNVFKRFMYFWTFLTLGMMVVGVLIGVSAGFNVNAVVNGVNKSVGRASVLTSWIPGWVGSFAFFFFLYKVVPNCLVRARNAAIGAAASATLLQLAATAYGLFVKDSKSYTTLYGALAQLPLFLTWMYICWTIILLGALLAWRMQEGFPTTNDDEALDTAGSPIDTLRNNQIKAVMPQLMLVAIHRSFQVGHGGYSPQALAHGLHLPLTWVTEAFDALEELGYIVASKSNAATAEVAVDVTDQYFPTTPPDQLKLARLTADFTRATDEWMRAWHHELPLEATRALRLLNDQKAAARDATLADLLVALYREPGTPAPTQFTTSHGAPSPQVGANA